jgi:integrase
MRQRGLELFPGRPVASLRGSPYQTRHTYATLALMSGVNPAYISRQLGHKNAKMLFEVYAKWIDQADRGREKAKIEAALRGEFVPTLSQNEGRSETKQRVVGRRDWIRTNDPHHVKVVL